jgi:hypothetical protein
LAQFDTSLFERFARNRTFKQEREIEGKAPIRELRSLPYTNLNLLNLAICAERGGLLLESIA